MSTTELKELRKEAKKYIDHADERVVKKVYEILEAEADWWNTMPDHIKAEVEESIAEADRGEVITHEEMKKKYPQWFTK